MKSFTHVSQAQRVVFANGALNCLAEEIDLIGAHRELILSTPQQRGDAQRVAELLGSRAAGLFDGAVMHVPIEVAREARGIATELGADCAVAIGGGSTIGLGKAIALESGLPILAIPTTYAGSEMTPIYGITEDGLKKTGRDWRVMPRTVIYDPELTASLAALNCVTSGINAIAHAAEALYSPDATPVADLMAQEGIRALGGRGRAAPCSARSAWVCITSFATRSAAASISRTRRPTRSCCRMRSPTTLKQRPRRCSRLRRPGSLPKPARPPARRHSRPAAERL